MTHQYGIEFGMPALIEVPVSCWDRFGERSRLLARGMLGGVGMPNMLKQQAVFVHNRMMTILISLSTRAIASTVPSLAFAAVSR
jgi:hypothetical protein